MRQRLEKGQHFENGPKFTPFGRHVAEFVGGQAHYGRIPGKDFVICSYGFRFTESESWISCQSCIPRKQ